MAMNLQDNVHVCICITFVGTLAIQTEISTSRLEICFIPLETLSNRKGANITRLIQQHILPLTINAFTILSMVGIGQCNA